ncbi:MAG: hypothetical protein WBQ76_03710 [Candidatus Korobacteraceae bacterium]
MIKVHATNGVVIECETPDLRDVLDSLGEPEKRTAPVIDSSTERTEKAEDPDYLKTKVMWNDKAALLFWNSLHGTQKKLVEYLLHNGGEAATEEVLAAIGLQNRRQLAGILCNITRNAQRETGNQRAYAVNSRVLKDGRSGYYVVMSLQRALGGLMVGN